MENEAAKTPVVVTLDTDTTSNGPVYIDSPPVLEYPVRAFDNHIYAETELPPPNRKERRKAQAKQRGKGKRP